MPGRRDFVPRVSAEIERLAVRAWPPAEVEEVGGWLVRRTAGVDRRRSNSLLPPFDDGAALAGLDGALARAVELGVPEAVQVSPLEVHPRLDAELAARGSVVGSPTGVLRGPVGVGESSVAVDIVGVGVAQDGWLGLFSVTTAPSARRHGVGRAVVGALGGWAAQRGARESYVQVELENLPALAFWASLGFTVAHRYHWRIGGSTGELA
jgi:GNAT superfamily N-acetyltransferase